MSSINFNLAGLFPYDCLYYDKEYGYRACVNGKRMTIASADTLKSLKEQMGLPEYHIAKSDLGRFEACLYGEK